MKTTPQKDDEHAGKRKRILVTGCFDILHPGHIYLINEASKRGEVYVIVARDETIKKFKNQYPIIPEEQRVFMVNALKNVKKAVLGNVGKNFIQKALSLEPDVILLGPNQRIREEELEELLRDAGAEHIKVERLAQIYTECPLYSSTAIKEKILREYKKGKNNNGTFSLPK